MQTALICVFSSCFIITGDDQAQVSVRWVWTFCIGISDLNRPGRPTETCQRFRGLYLPYHAFDRLMVFAIRTTHLNVRPIFDAYLNVHN